MLIWLASFPRSGNTMVRVYLTEIYGFRCRSLYDESASDGQSSMERLLIAEPPVAEADVTDLVRNPAPIFVKTHGPPTDALPALAIVRDGRDALVSYAHFVRSFEPGYAERSSFEDVLRLLVASKEHFGGWSANVLAWKRRPGESTSIVRFEDLLQSPRATLETALMDLGIESREAGDASIDFDDLQRVWPKFFRRGQAGAWRDEMPNHVHELFWQHHREAMEALGYEDEDVRVTQTGS